MASVRYFRKLPVITLETVFFLLLVIAALIDLFRHQIPNWVTGGGILVALAGTFADPVFTTDLTSTLIGLVTGLAFLFPFFLLGKVGAGDVKLLGMAGAYLGPLPLFWGGLFSLIAGGVLAIVWILMLQIAPRQIRRMVPNASSGPQLFASPREQSDAFQARRDLTSDPRRLPYAVAIAVGCSLAYLGFY